MLTHPSKKMHPLETNNLLGYDLSSTNDGGDCFGIHSSITMQCAFERVEHLLYLLITISRLSADVDLGAHHKMLINTPASTVGTIAYPQKLARRILVLAYCEKVTMKDPRAIPFITDYVDALGVNVVEMYPPHPKFKEHVSMISRKYAVMLKECLERVESNII